MASFGRPGSALNRGGTKRQARLWEFARFSNTVTSTVTRRGYSGAFGYPLRYDDSWMELPMFGTGNWFELYHLLFADAKSH